MPRYVILHHTFPSGHASVAHWDLMLENAGSLRTWAIESEPYGTEVAQARQLPDHRLAYLDYEGPISGDRGSVSRWDTGQYEVELEADDCLQVRLAGGRVAGLLTITRAAGATHFWRVSFGAAPTSG